MKINKLIIGYVLIFTSMFSLFFVSIVLDEVLIFISWFIILILGSYLEIYLIYNKSKKLFEASQYQEAILYLETKINNNFLKGTNNYCIIQLIILYMMNNQLNESKKLLDNNPKLIKSRDLFYIRFLFAVAEEEKESIDLYANKVLSLKQKRYINQQNSVRKILEMLKTNIVNKELYGNTKFPLVKKICERINNNETVIELPRIVDKIQNNNDRFNNCTGIRRISSALLNVITCLTIPIALIIISRINIGFNTTLLENSYRLLKNIWIFYLFLPITIGNIIYSLYLKSKKYKYESSLVLGMVFSILLFLFGTMSILSFKFSEDKAYLYALEETINIDLPDDFTIVIEDYTGGIQTSNDNCIIKCESVVRPLNNDTTYYEQNYWTEELANVEMMPSLFVYQTESYEYFLVYCIESKEYNPEVFEENYNYVAIAYDKDKNNLIIYEYFIK